MACRFIGVAIALLFAGCSATHDPLPNKTTNWLRECTSDRMCSDGLSCLCGVCTKTCGQIADCATDPATTRCSAVSKAALSNQCTPASAGDAVAICVAACAKDSDCKSSSGDFECRDQLCVVRPDAGRPSDAGAMRAADAGRDINPFPLDGSVHPTPSCAVLGTCDGGLGENFCTDTGDAGDAGSCLQPCNVVCKSGQMCFGDTCADVLAANQALPTSQALDSSRLYWTTTGTRDDLNNYRKDGAIQSVSLQGGAVTTLAANRFFPSALAINATHAYWLEGSGHDALGGENTSNDNAVWRVPLAGGDPERLANALPMTDGLAVDARYVYLLIEEPGDAGAVNSAVQRMPNDGSAQPERLFGVEGSGGKVFVDDTGLCWFGLGTYSAGQVGTASIDGADPHVLSMTGNFLGAVTVDASAIYWIGGYTTAIGDVPRAGGDAHVLARESSWGAPAGIAVDRDYVYSGHREGQSTIWSVARTDKLLGTSQVLLSGSALQYQMMLSVDDAALYIVAQGDPYGSNGVVLRVAKP